MNITGCKDEKVRESLWPKQLLFAAFFLCFYLAAALLGFFNFVGGIFG